MNVSDIFDAPFVSVTAVLEGVGSTGCLWGIAAQPVQYGTGVSGSSTNSFEGVGSSFFGVVLPSIGAQSSRCVMVNCTRMGGVAFGFPFSGKDDSGGAKSTVSSFVPGDDGSVPSKLLIGTVVTSFL